MMNTVEQSYQQLKNGLIESDDLFSMPELSKFDLGKFTVTYNLGSERFYEIKSHRFSQMIQMMDTFRKQERFCDVVLSVQGQRFPAHKIVLASVSSYFASMFSQSSHIESQTKDDIDLSKLVPCPIAMQTILDFIYSLQIRLYDKSALTLLTCSIPLLLDDLADVCIHYLCDEMHPSNCVGLFLYGKEYLCEALMDAAENYIFDHFEEVVRHEEFLSLSFNDLCKVIKDDKLKVECESVVYSAVMLWVRHDPKNRCMYLKKLLPCVRLELLPFPFVQSLMNCREFDSVEMQDGRDHIKRIHDALASHRYCRLPPRREAVKPLVIYCAGGYINKSINTMECYFLKTGEWKRCEDFTIPRSGVAVTSVFMKVYVIGGRHSTKSDNHDCREVECYDPLMNKWKAMPSMIHPRNRLGVAVIDTNIYAVGGSYGQQIHSSVEKFTALPEGTSWVEVAPMSTPRIGLAVCTNTRLLYAIGGFDGRQRLASVECYDPDKNLWKYESPLLISRSGAAAASFAQYIYVVGGYASDMIEGPMQLDAVERYDVITQQWSLVKPMKYRRSALSCVVLNNQIFAIGGYDGKHFSSVVEVYDPEKDQWTLAAPLTQERSGHGSTLTIEPTLCDDR